MPGILGIAQHPAPGLQVLERMSAVMRHHEWYGTRVSTADGFAGAAVGLSQAVADAAVWVNSVGSVVMLDGEIDDFAQCHQELARAGVSAPADSPAAIFLAGFERFGDEFLAGLSGYFAAAIWQPSTATLRLITDRFGMKPLYYAAHPAGLVFASELKALLQCPPIHPSRSLRGVSQFFTFGQLLGEETLYEPVRYTGAAICLTYEHPGGRLHSRRYWQMTPGEPLVDRRGALEQLEATFRGAVERRLHGPKRLGLSLSGGLDARTILAAVPPGVPLKSVSLGIKGSIDHRVASELAGQAGVDHHQHYLDSGFLDSFPQHLQTLVWLTDGHYLDQAITVPTLPLYRQLGIDAVLRGHAGELFHMDKAYAFSIRPDELGFASAEAAERWLWRHLTTYMIADIGHEMFRPDLRQEAVDLARDSLRRALADAHAFTPPSQALWHLFISQRLRRETAMSMQMFTSVVDVRLPYLDNDLVDLVMRIPPALKMGDQIQSFILARTRPAFMKVTNANTGSPLGAGRWARQLSSMRLRILSKLRVPGYQPYERLGLWLSEDLQPLVRELVMSDRTLDRGLFDRAVLRRLVDEHGRRVRNHTFLLMALMIFETGQRQIADGDGRPAPVGLPTSRS